ncbi:2-oxoglutarate (2OG) and Fe(II)-dependent oxygenase superfamily protein [Striga asiatica]|uniref:2-oxoglutarate (2OG) and Fe(II)-dependent oxygenase superfamily protein n=1 Tax=Striga asiatica TaxID=4170 RepID=A0A5A7QBN8_STRAF|nr:2-oxoglutarate (2OG) and Fe(II)-dependent oxygenase superfamily protein [Striga asiatica]
MEVRLHQLPTFSALTIAYADLKNLHVLSIHTPFQLFSSTLSLFSGGKSFKDFSYIAKSNFFGRFRFNSKREGAMLANRTAVSACGDGYAGGVRVAEAANDGEGLLRPDDVTQLCSSSSSMDAQLLNLRFALASWGCFQVIFFLNLDLQCFIYLLLG